MKRQWIIILLLIIVASILLVIFWPKHNKKSAVTHPYYVALGDSVAAGDGLETDSDSSACNRTNEAYPHVVATQRGFRLNSIACSGATIEKGILGQQNVNGALIKPQIENLFAGPLPKYITITIGANDIGWTQFINKCTVKCTNQEDAQTINDRLSILKVNLSRVLNNINSHYGTNTPSVYLTSYYQVYTTNGCSSNNSKPNSNSAGGGADPMAQLDNTIKSVSDQYAFSHYVHINFVGHELCSSDPWVQGLTDPAPFHPTTDGQTAIAHAVLNVMK